MKTYKKIAADKKRIMTATAGAAAAVLGLSLGLTGCAAGSQTSLTVPEIVKVQNVENSNVISVTGKEEVKVVPDMAEIVYSVYSRGSTAAACQDTNAKDLDSAIEVLKGLGIAETSIQTSSYGLNPIRNWNSDTQEITGYEMTTTITVSDVPIDQAGTVITKSIEAGVNSMESIRYFSSNYDASYQEALKGAMAVAKAKAEAIAEASGASLGGVIHVQEQGYNPSARYSNAAMPTGKALAADTAAIAEMSVMPGEVSIEATVSVDFSLAQ